MVKSLCSVSDTVLICNRFCVGRVAGFCALCAMQRHVRTALQSTGRSVAPKYLVSNLRCMLLRPYIIVPISVFLLIRLMRIVKWLIRRITKLQEM